MVDQLQRLCSCYDKVYQRVEMKKNRKQDAFRGLSVALPAGMKLSVPYNHQTDLLEALEEISGYLAYLFLPFHPDTSLSGRAYSGSQTGRGYASELNRVAKWCARTGTGMNLVANAPAWAVDHQKVASTAARLRDKVERLKVTFADLLAARETRRLAPWLEIGVSCLADVQTPVQAMWWREQVGATHLTVSREINRKPDRLSALKDCGMILSVVSFDDCVPGCQVRGRHFIPKKVGSKNKGSLGTFVAACDPGNIDVRLNRPWLLAQKEILPGHLQHLDGIIPEIKVSGRDMDTMEVIRRIGLYLEANSLSHPNGYYSEPLYAWQHLAKCARNCPDCQWCAENILSGSDSAGSAIRSAMKCSSEEAQASVTLTGPDGAAIRLWIEPENPSRPPLCSVAGLGIYFRVLKSVELETAETLVRYVANLLRKSKKEIDQQELLAAVTRFSLPGGFHFSDRE
jgi:hypothetical protein